MKSYLTLIRQVLPYRRYVLLFAMFSVLTVVFSLVSLVLLVPFLELLFDKTPLVSEKPKFAMSTSYFVQNFYYYLSLKIINSGKVAALGFFCVIVSCVFLLKNLFRYLALYVLSPLRNRLIFDLRDRLFQKLLNLPVSFFHKQSKGDLITKFTSDLTEIEYSIMNTLETSIQSPLNIVLFLGAMLLMSVKLTLFVFAMILVMALFIGRIGKSLKKENAQGKEVLGRLTAILDETISGIKIIQSYFSQDWIYDKFSIENKAYFDTFNSIYRKRDLSSPLTEFLAIIVVCIVLWFGGNLVLNGSDLTAPIFISFMVVFSQLIPPAKSFASALYEIKKGMASYDRIQTILQEESVQANKNGLPISSFEKSLTLSNISYTYPNAIVAAITNFNYEFLKGKKYAIVGQSGAGKSTLLDIILGFVQADGEVRLDNELIEQYSLKDYRGLFGLVSQEAILFNYSVSENISFDARNTSVDQALVIGNSESFAHKLGSNPIGERGAFLSGGEKQRLTISRVAYRNPEIVLMDEATSALDSQNEHEVQLAMDNLLQNKTSIVIAHRLSTVRNADCILVMKQGRMIATGSHEELYSSSEDYKKMVDLQSLS